ncbi:CPBP family intramembrane glutamic endopeptidase [Pseudomarimonas arenosa]|uniref:CPBP family intramembrane metalloprotease n=1 Tax=Pseudomarimonas arenosa TaxID=2774145 RepID=A0AAW3ZM77_9GAMM|nr:CPBP family intramembrane glutamic endopeptidase [Pseudomarimonas arenosa]MBD8526838.1 CPBP family intramembrane metalloprotease [Pseudomarimonas arenosa]
MRSLWVFLGVSFGFSWGLAELTYRVWQPEPLGLALMLMVYMWGPGLGAIAARCLVEKQPLRSLGPLWRWSPWLLVAWLAPLPFALAHVLLSVLAPGVSLSVDIVAVREVILLAVAPEQQAAARSQLEALGEWLVLAMIAQIVIGGLLAGATINALGALGEELGWRGYLQQHWARLGFWRCHALIGVVWGVWHWPAILRGHNYPDHPYWGLAMMVLFCVSAAPLFGYLRDRAGSLLAPVLAHGVLNATGGVVLFVVGASDLWRGPAGLAGVLVLALINLGLFFHRRRQVS